MSTFLPLKRPLFPPLFYPPNPLKCPPPMLNATQLCVLHHLLLFSVLKYIIINSCYFNTLDCVSEYYFNTLNCVSEYGVNVASVFLWTK